MTLRDNILFGREFDKKRYVDTMLACQLEPDLKEMPAGDLSEIGEKGINLSGGQKARVSLARAVYKDSDIILMDDPISALDAHVRKQVFLQVFQGLLKDRTRILVTHAIDFVHLADRVVIMKKGKVQAQGTYEELKDNEYMQQVMDIHKAHTKESKEIAEKAEHTNEFDLPEKSDESDQEEALANLGLKLDNLCMTEDELDKKLKVFEGKKNDAKYAEDLKNAGSLFEDEAKEHLSVSKDTYKQVFQRAGGLLPFVVLLAAMLFNHFFHVNEEYEWQTWGKTSFEEQQDRYAAYTWTLTKYALTGALVNLAVEVFVSLKAKQMGKNVHQSLLTKVMNAPINLFFDVTPVGKIFKRFSDDIHVFNGGIFHGFRRIFGDVTYLIFLFSLMLQFSSWILIFSLVLICLCYQFVKPYLYIDNQLHRVGHALHSPMESYMDQALRGNSIIRAFDQTESYQMKRRYFVDKTTVNFITHHSCWVWFNLRIYYCSKLIFLAALAIVISMKGTSDDILLSILFTRTLDLDWTFHCIFGTYNWVERMMVQVERILKMERIPQEKNDGTQKVDKAEWPSQGGVDFQDVVLRYRQNTDIVLNKLSFEVKAGEKVGIVGRTGAGKSTISAALSRIVELEAGKIVIDGVDIAKIDMQDLREQVTQIPQDPTLFTGSLRYNLDPFNKESDERIEELVKKAGLEHLLTKSADDSEENKKKKNDKRKKEEIEEEKKYLEKFLSKEDLCNTGLYYKIKENGSNLSVGERQLVCIIRAILRRNKIILLDEATANIDVVTEQTIQKLIAEEFAGATVLTIAHRLNTIIKSDKVLILDKGQKVEYDSPQQLMANPDSHFSKLLKDLKKAKTEEK